MMKKEHQHSYYDKDRFKIIQTSMEKMFSLDLSEEIEEIKQEILQYREFLDRNIEDMPDEDESLDIREESEIDPISEQIEDIYEDDQKNFDD